jgi:hypothetical protein
MRRPLGGYRLAIMFGDFVPTERGPMKRFATFLMLALNWFLLIEVLRGE